MQGECDKAAELYERSLAIREKTLGPDHHGLAPALNNLAMLLKKQVEAVGSFQDSSLMFSVDVVMFLKPTGVLRATFEESRT